MNTIQDVLYNYLSIAVVSEHLPEDEAARDTVAFFTDALWHRYEAKVKDYTCENNRYHVTVTTPEGEQTYTFPQDYIEHLWHSMSEDQERYCSQRM